MGHKVHPTGFRLGVIRDWQAKWYSEKHYAEFLQEDVKLREAIKSKYSEAAISLVEIERQAKDVTVTLHTARPGIVIGRGGQRVDEMRFYLEHLIGKRVRLNILEIRQPELDAYLVARAIAEQIQRRVAYRRAMKQAIFRTIQAGAKGIKVSCAGRLGNAEIARRQTMHEGQVPLHTLRADIDYGFTEAHTTLGRIGVKVWVYKGQILPELKVMEVEEIPGGLVEKPAEVVAESAEAAPAVELEEKPVELVADKSAETAPAVELEKKPAKPRARRSIKPAVSAEPEEKPVELVADKSAETAPAVELEKKPAKPRARRSTKTAASAEPEKKPTKPAARRRKKATAAEPEKNIAESTADIAAEAEPSTLMEKEEKDAAT